MNGDTNNRKEEESKIDLSIKVYESGGNKAPQIKLAEQGIFPEYPYYMLLVGRSNSGKTMCLQNLFREEHLYKDYFHEIIYFSPNGKTEKLVLELKLPPENIITEIDEGEKLQMIVDAQDETVEEKGKEWVLKNQRVAIIFDDIITYKKFLRSNVFTFCATGGRHIGIACFLLSQYYKAIPVTVRTNARAIIYFPSCESENDKFAEENAGVGLSKAEMKNIIHFATKVKHEFLFVNHDQEIGKKFSKNFDTPINVREYIGNAKQKRQELLGNVDPP